jgi:hypothetical protein
MLSDLEKTATILQSHLGSSLRLRLLDKTETFQFFSYLFNLEEWAARDQLRSDTGVDRQIVKSPVAWHSDHVTVGKRHVQMFSLKTTVKINAAERCSLVQEVQTVRREHLRDRVGILCLARKVEARQERRRESSSRSVTPSSSMPVREKRHP